MAISKLKTNLALLRKSLGDEGKLKEFSKITRLSESWIKKASAGLIPVRPPVARLISLVAGCDEDWIQGTQNKKITKAEKKKQLNDLVRLYRKSLYQKYGITK